MVEWEWADPAWLDPPRESSFKSPERESIDWGWISTKPEYGVDITALALSFDLDEPSLTADIYGWFGKLTDWLQAYTLQVLTPQSTDEGTPSRSIRAWRIVNGRSEEAAYIPPRRHPHVPASILVTPSIWAASVRRSSVGDELPLSWQLLGDGLRALHADHPRRAVIEAFTALEVMLREAIRRRVELCDDPPVANVIVKQRNTLWPLVNMAKDLGIELPEDLTKRLVEMRNSVVHRGNLPTLEDALTIWEVAHEFSLQQSPLPPP
jgi:hypothetical protein